MLGDSSSDSDSCDTSDGDETMNCGKVTETNLKLEKSPKTKPVIEEISHCKKETQSSQTNDT